MKVVITGASGFVGRSLVTALGARGFDLLLVGRDPERMRALFPGMAVCGYDALVDAGRGYDLLVHLAVANNDRALDLAGFREINVEFLGQVAEDADRAGIGRFLNISSVHALDLRNNGGYAVSKREGHDRLKDIRGARASTWYLPAVQGEEWGGKLRVLNRMPKWLSAPLTSVLKAVKPTVTVDCLARSIAELAEGDRADRTDRILSEGQLENPAFNLIKRVIDLGFAVAIILVFWWLLLIVWVAIRVQSEGPGVFRQDRVGRNGKIFTCYKFRTMKVGTVQAGTHNVSAVAVTDGLGQFLRRTKIDELPQVWNILRNEISLVGPRPCLPVQEELVEERRRRSVLRVMPGITGLAQSEGIDMSDPVRLAVRDAEYVALQSLSLDLGILARTLLGGGQGDKVGA